MAGRPANPWLILEPAILWGWKPLLQEKSRSSASGVGTPLLVERSKIICSVVLDSFSKSLFQITQEEQRPPGQPHPRDIRPP